jgi:hypothetical protein
MMQESGQSYQHSVARTGTDLREPVRNNYFYGKLLDVFHFRLEHEYFNSKRWLLNRLVIGPGVVCGLDVILDKDKLNVIVSPGLAIDRCGHEIIVASPSHPVLLTDIPPYPSKTQSEGYQSRSQRPEYCELPYKHVVLCYHECLSDPVPALANDCGDADLCAPGSIRERYSVSLRDKHVQKRKSDLPKDIVSHGKIDHDALTTWVSRQGCRPRPDDCCIPLANIHLKDVGAGWEPEIDISIRRVVYTNRLLFDLLNAMTTSEEMERGE